MAKVVIVSGTSRGIGLSTCKQLLRKGVTVVGVSRNAPTDEFLLSKSNEFIHVAGDVTDPATVEKLVKTARAHGKIIGVVPNAGIADVGRIIDTSIETTKHIMDVNYFAVVNLVQQCISDLLDTKGRVVLMLSGVARIAHIGWSAYSCSKAALNMFGSVLSQEHPDITTVQFRPGRVATDMYKHLCEKGKTVMDPAYYAGFTDGTDPSLIGCITANLVLHVTKNFNGKFISWNDEEMAPYRVSTSA